MKLCVKDLLREVSNKQDFEIKEKFDNLELAGEEIRFDNPVLVKGTITNESKILKIVGTIGFKLIVNCHRCSAEIKQEFNLEINESFSSSNQGPEDTYLFSGTEIDLSEMVKDIILSNVPMKILCDEKCLGLCSECGKNMNLEKCSCKDESYDPRFQKLKELKNNL